MAIIKDLPKSKRDEYFKRAEKAGLKASNLFLWAEETFEKKIAELEQNNVKNEQTTENVNKTAENVVRIAEPEKPTTKATKPKLCHICKIPIVNGKCEKCGEVYGGN